MSEIIVPPVKVEASQHQTVEYLIYFFFGVLEVLLIFRFFLKLASANPYSGFVNFVYSLTSVFIMPFSGMFRQYTTIFEPATLVAAIVYILVAWGIVKLISISSGEKQEN